MRVSVTQNGLTLRAVAGTNNVILGMDLEQGRRSGCLGFSIHRTDLGSQAGPAPAVPDSRWLPNRITFPNDPDPRPTTRTAPLQKFRWGDYTVEPGHSYRYRVYARYGAPAAILAAPPGAMPDGDPFVEVTVNTEDPKAAKTAVFFNRGAAASLAYNEKFGQKDPEELLASTDAAERAKGEAALKWLSRGLEEAIEAFIGQADGPDWALHAAVYEFQKPNLLAALKKAAQAGATVEAVYHYRCKQRAKEPKLTEAEARAALARKQQGNATKKDRDLDLTWIKNLIATEDTKLAEDPGRVALFRRQADPQDGISHNKFVVLLHRSGAVPGRWEPRAVWTGSTNWTDGGIYGQLNVGHAVFDADVAARYEAYFQLLRSDADAATMKAKLAGLTPVPSAVPAGHGVQPILSPQTGLTMLDLYAAICKGARCLMVCAPFALHSKILSVLKSAPPETLRLLLLDQQKSVGGDEGERVIEQTGTTETAVAAPLASPLHAFQRRLLADTGPEHFHHPGIHIHSKIILADPFGADPILVTGSANFSKNSTEVNDSNSLVIRGDTAVADIYATEFMRMFEHYHFRGARNKAEEEARAAGHPGGAAPLQLKEDDSWSEEYYQPGSLKGLDRRMFAGTLS